MKVQQAGKKSPGWDVMVLGTVWIVLYFAVRMLLEAQPEMSRGVRLGLAFVPTPVFALFLWRFIAAIRAGDELERRIQLEALGIAFPLGILLLTTLGLVQRAVTLNFQDWSYNHVWPIFALFYVFGLMFARKRYT